MVKNISSDSDKSGQGAISVPAAPYVVLARKYRPETFTDLIGQDTMVTTLKNAFATDRIAQAYMLTGVRGVGKTTTARILARALNYEKDGFPDRPTIDMDGYGRHCLEIIQSRHTDVLEMDAASNTGVDNIREIIQSARYRPLVARYKVFIIDEVHMLSKGAFNALLKTLEEPPEHVKFIFATTEVRKVPVTVLSRCQRFDLRRVELPVLVAHFDRIAKAEGATAQPDALRWIARAAEGSVRDGLSILDQAIAMGSGKVTTNDVRQMLGLADRGRIFDLLEVILKGDAAGALAGLDALHHDGAEAQQVLADLAETVHAVTRAKVAGDAGAGDGYSVEENRRATALGAQLSVAILSRAWQMLLKGQEEAARAANPVAAAEMVLVRLAYTSDLPSPDEIIRTLGRGSAGATGPRPESKPAPADRPVLNETRAPAPMAEAPRAPAEAPQPQLRSFNDVLAFVAERRDAKLLVDLEEHVSLVRFEPGHLEVHLLPGAPSGLAGELSEKLGKWTGRRWIVVLSRQPGERPLGIVRREREAAELAELSQHPAVRAVLDAFPETRIAAVRPMTTPAKDETGTG